MDADLRRLHAAADHILSTGAVVTSTPYFPEAARLLAERFKKEHRADDEELSGQAWLKQVGVTAETRFTVDVRTMTRGNFRLLAKALKITLNEKE